MRRLVVICQESVERWGYMAVGVTRTVLHGTERMGVAVMNDGGGACYA